MDTFRPTNLQEESATSEKHMEHAIPVTRQTTCLKAQKKTQQEAAKVLREQRKQKRIQERTQKLEERLAKMSLEQREKWGQKQQAKKEHRDMLNELSSEERKQFRKQRRETRQAQRLAKLLPEQLVEWNRKQALTKEELKTEREKRKTAYKNLLSKRMTMEQFQQNNWSENKPKPSFIIVDGNNLRGGGPRRQSQKQICKLAEQQQECLGIPTILYFDGPQTTLQSTLEVRFSADDTIINWIQSVYPIKVLVITNDRGLVLELWNWTVILCVTVNIALKKTYEVSRLILKIRNV